MSDTDFDLYSAERLHNVRRTLEAGLRAAQVDDRCISVGQYIDLFQHALDELAAAGVNHHPDCDEVRHD